MTECKPVTTPLDRNLKLDVESDIEEYLILCLIYLTITRPDLRYSVGLLTQFMQTLHEIHPNCAQRVPHKSKSQLSIVN